MRPRGISHTSLVHSESGLFLMMLLINKSLDLKNRKLLIYNLTVAFTCPLFSSCKMSSPPEVPPFQVLLEKINKVVIFQFFFQHLHAVDQLVAYIPSRTFPSLGTRNSSGLHSLIRPPRRPLQEGESLFRNSFGSLVRQAPTTVPAVLH